MERAHYGLQALLYTAALHRYLRWRLRRLRPRAPPRRRALPVRARDDGAGHADRRRRARAASSPGGRRRRSSSRSATCSTGEPHERVDVDEPRRDDPLDVRRARTAPGLLRAFNDIGVLAAADVHVAVRLAALAGETDESIALAAALAVRAPRLGHVYVDLADDPRHRRGRVRRARRPLRAALAGGRGLARARWRRARSSRWGRTPPRAGRCGSSAAGSTSIATGARSARSRTTCARSAARNRSTSRRARLTASTASSPAGRRRRQRAAAATAVRRRFAVVAGGPGTGKTTTVARIVALLAEQARQRRAAPLVALAAPTGQGGGAARGGRARRGARSSTSRRAIRDALLALNASTLHRLLGWRPDSHSRFRHNRGNRLPHDVVIVDETSMVSLSLMARLVEAVRPEARLVLVGDPGQLTSIEAGAVLGDIVRAGGDGRRRPRARLPLRRGHRRARGRDPQRRRRRGHRGAARRATRTSLDPGRRRRPRGRRTRSRRSARRAGRRPRGDRRGPRRATRAAALAALGAFRVLCAHRRGAYGVERVDGADRGLARRRARARPLVRRAGRCW